MTILDGANTSSGLDIWQADRQLWSTVPIAGRFFLACVRIDDGLDIDQILSNIPGPVCLQWNRNQLSLLS